MHILPTQIASAIALLHGLLLAGMWCVVWRMATALERRAGPQILAAGGLLAILAGVLTPTLGRPAWLLLQATIRQSIEPLVAEWLVIALSLGWPAVLAFGVGVQLVGMADVADGTVLRG